MNNEELKKKIADEESAEEIYKAVYRKASEVIDEFVERLKELLTKHEHRSQTDGVPFYQMNAESFCDEIDDIAAEMLQEVEKWEAYNRHISEYKKHRIFIPKAVDDGCAFESGGIKQLYGNEEVEQIVKEREEYKHRAEIAEKAGRIIQREMARVFDISNPRACELIANIWDLAKKQAEKELAEEGKDENI